jgi:hypothetical protein
VERAQIFGSLELAGITGPSDQLVASHAALHRARRAVAADARFGGEALLSWHQALIGTRAWRQTPRERVGTAVPTPPEWIAERVDLLAEWIGSESGRALPAAAAGALVLARLLEILPFEDGNGRISRLAASHVMVQAGAAAPILEGRDAQRLETAVQAAFRLETAALAELLEEASARATRLAQQAGDGGGGRGV